MSAPHPPAPAAAGDFARGLAGVVAGRTAICSLDGDLRYRGYAAEPLARAGDFEEVAFLLLHGELPTAEQRTAFAGRLHAAAAGLDPAVVGALASLAAGLLVPSVLLAQGALPDSQLVRSLTYRNIGPASMSGRITDIAVVEGPRSVRGGRLGTTMYVAVATGGIWKSTNAGLGMVKNGEHVLLLNDDVRITDPLWLARLVDDLEQDGVGAAPDRRG